MLSRTKDLMVLVRHLKQGVPLYRIDKIFPFVFRFLLYGDVIGVLYSDRHLGSGLYKVKVPSSELVLDRSHYAMLRLEENNYWKRFYAPIDLTGLRVLDAGAGNGETLPFYLQRNVKSIRAVECDRQTFTLLESNVLVNGWNNVELRYKKFSIEDLQDIDFAKIDVEEGETELLKLDSLPCSMLVEAHTPEIKDLLMKKFLFTCVYNSIHYSFLLYLK